MNVLVQSTTDANSSTIPHVYICFILAAACVCKGCQVRQGTQAAADRFLPLRPAPCYFCTLLFLQPPPCCLINLLLLSPGTTVTGRSLRAVPAPFQTWAAGNGCAGNWAWFRTAATYRFLLPVPGGAGGGQHLGWKVGRGQELEGEPADWCLCPEPSLAPCAVTLHSPHQKQNRSSTGAPLMLGSARDSGCCG